jgi:hypothetical protein
MSDADRIERALRSVEESNDRLRAEIEKQRRGSSAYALGAAFGIVVSALLWVLR